MIQNEYITKTYAGWLGKVIGIRMGAPIEGWTREKIALFYGEEMKDYVVKYEDFAADDDSNGPLFFTRGLEHYKELTARTMGYTCLNYIPKERGFFWWGEELSTEHTAFKNLYAGMEAPQSGSAAVNGVDMSEQIGGQIFIDGFGFVAPGNPKLAAELAEASARVTHDLDGVEGAKFIAACIALAYAKSDIKAIMEEALTLISSNGNYYKVIKEMMTYYETGRTKEEAFQCLRDNYWSDRHQGHCHIVPNAGIIAIALLYGEGNFLTSMELVNLLGFDTDCNAGNLGAILGVMCGTYEDDSENGIPTHLITPIQDIMIASSVVGSLNISTVSENTLLFAKIGYDLAGQEMPAPYRQLWTALEQEGKRISHFEFVDSIHGFRIKGNYKNPELSLTNTTEESYTGNRSLKVRINNIHPENEVQIYQKTYYEPEDLHDARYQPSFSPIAYTGDSVCCRFKHATGQKLMVQLYCYDVVSHKKYCFSTVEVNTEEWITLSGTIPMIPNARIKEVGIQVISKEEEDLYFGEQVILYVDEFVIEGTPEVSIEFNSLSMESYSLHSSTQKELSGFTHYQSGVEGIELIEDGVVLSHSETIFTGDYYWRDYRCGLDFVMKQGNFVEVLVRAQGNLRSYGVQVAGNRLQMVRNEENRQIILGSIDVELECEKEYRIEVCVVGNQITATMEGHMVSVEDNQYAYGMIGIRTDEESALLLKKYTVVFLPHLL